MVNYKLIIEYHQKGNNTQVCCTGSSVIFDKMATNGTYAFYAVDGFSNNIICM